MDQPLFGEKKTEVLQRSLFFLFFFLWPTMLEPNRLLCNWCNRHDLRFGISTREEKCSLFLICFFFFLGIARFFFFSLVFCFCWRCFWHQEWNCRTFCFMCRFDLYVCDAGHSGKWRCFLKNIFDVLMFWCLIWTVTFICAVQMVSQWRSGPEIPHLHCFHFVHHNPLWKCFGVLCLYSSTKSSS
jgi:hypothetical protein